MRRYNIFIILQVTLCEAFAEILSMWSGDFEFTINTTIFNRIPFHKQVNEILGDFTSTILLAVDWTKDSFRERLPLLS
jgi:non-ribosomal peptide synthetase component F